MRRFIISLLFPLLIAASTVYFYALPKAESQIIDMLEEAGFKNINTTRTKLLSSGLIIQNIHGDNINLQNIETQLYWPTYLLDGKIDQIMIDQLEFKVTFNQRNRTLIKQLPQKIDALDLNTTPNIKIDLLQIAISDNIKLKGNLTKTTDKINIDLNTDSDLLTLNSKWELSKNSEEDTTKLYADINTFSIQNKYLSLNRANGWIAYEIGEDRVLNAQLEAGSGMFFNAPLNDINIVAGKDNKHQSLLIRSKASGFPNITLNKDLEWTDNFDIKLFKTYFSFPSSKTLKDYLFANKITQQNPLQEISLDATETIIEYLPERRFADGPYPLEIKTVEKNKDRLVGTVLIYPENYDIRGTLTGTKDIITLLDQIIPIGHEKISEETIRLEGNLTN